jgi:hypothetical protein
LEKSFIVSIIAEVIVIIEKISEIKAILFHSSLTILMCVCIIKVGILEENELPAIKYIDNLVALINSSFNFF